MKLMLAVYCTIFLKAMQQQNVIGGHYQWAVLTSYMLAVVEVATIIWIVHTGWSAIPWVGTGASMGCISAMYIHRRFIRR